MRYLSRWDADVRAAAWAFLIIVAACSAPRDRAAASAARTAQSGSPAPGPSVSTRPVQEANATGSTAARAFVQSFYDWYVPIANKDNSGPAWYSVLDRRPFVLSDSLRNAMQNDREQASKAVGEIAGLDFDPFLASQDPCERYVAGDSINAGPIYHVPVYGICGKTRREKPDLVADVVRHDTVWTFADFRYPNAHDGQLTRILKRMSP
jgi:hypothetical protein